MANIFFTYLDQEFDISDASIVALMNFDAGDSTYYSYDSTGSDDLEIYGGALTNDGTFPTGGTITSVHIDLDNDSYGAPEIQIGGLSVPATGLGVGSGTSTEQRDKFWSVVLAGNDTFTLDLADFTQAFNLAGDGALVLDGQIHFGGNDQFIDAGSSLNNFNSTISGDLYIIGDGTVVGGADTLSAGARLLYGDSFQVSPGAALIGGDDLILPARLGSTGGGFHAADTFYNLGVTVGGDDVIDLRSTDFTSFSGVLKLYGDVSSNGATGSLIGGRDTIYGSDNTDLIYGDYEFNSGYVEGGRDRLLGYGGDDYIYGNEGRDIINGGSGNDSLDGGLDGDVIIAESGNDTLIGDTGNDSMIGGDGDDVFIAGSGRDTIDGGIGDDSGDAGAGHDLILGGTGKDNFFGGNGNDTLTGDGGNDTLSGGDLSDTLLGGNGFDVLLGGNDNDYLDGGASNDILLGESGADTFNFTTSAGTDTIRDFVAGAGLNDSIRLQGFGPSFDSFAEVIAVATDDGSHTTFNFGNGTVIIIENALVGDFDADDFTFA